MVFVVSLAKSKPLPFSGVSFLVQSSRVPPSKYIGLMECSIDDPRGRPPSSQKWVGFLFGSPSATEKYG